ncbi:hypothetical protein RP20_CCG017803 [Aedes albopictus]|nr:hypothetical protein RP20_CCG017803 [Aedes albopictus]
MNLRLALGLCLLTIVLFGQIQLIRTVQYDDDSIYATDAAVTEEFETSIRCDNPTGHHGAENGKSPSATTTKPDGEKISWWKRPYIWLKEKFS